MCKDNDKNKDKGGRRILVKMKDGTTIFILLLSEQYICIYICIYNGGA